MPAPSQNSAPALLVAAISGRALAAAARRAGYRPLVADLFRDGDTVALADRAIVLPGSLAEGIDATRLAETLAELTAGETPVAAICGSGFERRPEMVDLIAKHFPLAGNDARTIRRTKDARALADACADLGVPHPEVRDDPPPDPEHWIAKTRGGAGGSHVFSAQGAPAAPDRYFQRRLFGQSVSALFVADRVTAHIVGFSRQWVSPAPGAPYRYGGAVRLRRVAARETARVQNWLSGLTQHLGLVGLCGADFIRDGRDWSLVEINPRPGATLDLFDSTDAPLLAAHIDAARGDRVRLPRFADSMAAMIAYAERPVAEFPAFDWPDWTADRQPARSSLAAGDPVCTVFARDRTAQAAEIAVRDAAARLGRVWQGEPA